VLSGSDHLLCCFCSKRAHQTLGKKRLSIYIIFRTSNIHIRKSYVHRTCTVCNVYLRFAYHQRRHICRLFKYREYWMIYKEPDFLAAVYQRAPPPPPHPPSLPSVSSTSDSQEDWESEITCWRERGGGRAKSCEGEKAWSFINNSIFSYLVSHRTPEVSAA
jgi:hypothetical protein